jgi:hypothetical protein
VSTALPLGAPSASLPAHIRTETVRVLPTAYSNGKSAVRLQPGVVPSGVHRFRTLPTARKLVSRWVTPCIERYAEELGESCIGGGGGGGSDAAALSHPCLFHFVNCNFNVSKQPYDSLARCFHAPPRSVTSGIAYR